MTFSQKRKEHAGRKGYQESPPATFLGVRSHSALLLLLKWGVGGLVGGGGYGILNGRNGKTKLEKCVIAPHLPPNRPMRPESVNYCRTTPGCFKEDNVPDDGEARKKATTKL